MDDGSTIPQWKPPASGDGDGAAAPAGPADVPVTDPVEDPAALPGTDDEKKPGDGSTP